MKPDWNAIIKLIDQLNDAIVTDDGRDLGDEELEFIEELHELRSRAQRIAQEEVKQ